MGGVDSAPHDFSQDKMTFIQWGQYLPTNWADEAGVEELGPEREGRAMTGGSVVVFLQPVQELGHGVNIIVQIAPQREK